MGERAILLREKHFYGKKNFPVIRLVDRRDPVRLDERIFGQSAGNYTNPAWRHHKFRTDRRKGGAQRGHGFH